MTRMIVKTETEILDDFLQYPDLSPYGVAFSTTEEKKEIVIQTEDVTAPVVSAVVAEPQGLLPQHMWMLAVDGGFFKRENGPLGFAKREENSVVAILRGLVAAIIVLKQCLSRKITIKDIQSIHKACMTGVKREARAADMVVTPGAFRPIFPPVHFQIMPKWSSLAGLKQLIMNPASKFVLKAGDFVILNGVRKMNILDRPLDEKDDIKSIFRQVESGDKALTYWPPTDPVDIQKGMEKAIQMFNEIKQDASTDDFLKKLILAVQQMTSVHPFRDGNNRTFVNCIFNGSLLLKGLPPAIFEDPNIFECQTGPEIMQSTWEAMEVAKFAVKNTAGIYGFKEVDLSDFKNKKI